MAVRIRLGVNVDHVATVRQARRTVEPDPVVAAALAELAGADAITVHLREDRRHVQDRDVRLLRQTVRTALNLELARDPGVLAVARQLRPEQVTFVPERREEVTTEGGLDVTADEQGLSAVLGPFRELGVRSALFIDPASAQVRAARRVGADAVELHTGAYANARGRDEAARRLEDLRAAARLAHEEGLAVHAGHGLDYWNIHAVRDLPALEEVHIGHAIVARAVLVGMERAVREMRALL
ncbi:MAG: pyridoxine 5'-phosphate synthase [Planctomycetes bacterium]|nr:pyridoxine 5'-phosphate synthase [Planctomycetota bacterium]